MIAREYSCIRKSIVLCLLLSVLSGFMTAHDAQAEIFMSISGIVKDASTGRGISGVDIIAGGTKSTNVFLATTDSNGNYTIKTVPEGEYRLKINEPPANYVMVPYVKTVTVEKGKNVVNADFDLPLGGSISGILFKNDGSPLANASVYAVTNKGVAISETDANGKYVLTGLPPEHSTKLRIFTFGYSMVAVDNVVVTAGQVTSNINIILLSAASAATAITGVVTSYDSVGVPVANAYETETELRYSNLGAYQLYGNYELSVTIDRDSVSLLQEIITGLTGITTANKHDADILSEVVEELWSLDRRSASHAGAKLNIQKIIKVADELQKLSTDVSSIRLELDELLKIWEKKWFLSQVSGKKKDD